MWRPTGNTDGCYTLVDYNIPANATMAETIMTEEESEEERSERSASSEAASIIDAEGFISPSGDSSGHCAELSVRDNEQIEVRTGDVVGYYVDHFRAGKVTEMKVAFNGWNILMMSQILWRI